MTPLVHVAGLLTSAASSASLGLGYFVAQASTNGSVTGLVAGASSVASLGLVGWAWKIAKDWKTTADQDNATLRVQLDEIEAKRAAAEAKSEENHRKYETERRLRLELEEAGIKNRRRYPPPEGVEF